MVNKNRWQIRLARAVKGRVAAPCTREDRRPAPPLVRRQLPQNNSPIRTIINHGWDLSDRYCFVIDFYVGLSRSRRTDADLELRMDAAIKLPRPGGANERLFGGVKLGRSAKQGAKAAGRAGRGRAPPSVRVRGRRAKRELKGRHLRSRFPKSTLAAVTSASGGKKCRRDTPPDNISGTRKLWLLILIKY